MIRSPLVSPPRGCHVYLGTELEHYRRDVRSLRLWTIIKAKNLPPPPWVLASLLLFGCNSFFLSPWFPLGCVRPFLLVRCVALRWRCSKQLSPKSFPFTHTISLSCFLFPPAPSPSDPCRCPTYQKKTLLVVQVPAGRLSSARLCPFSLVSPTHPPPHSSTKPPAARAQSRKKATRKEVRIEARRMQALCIFFIFFLQSNQ